MEPNQEQSLFDSNMDHVTQEHLQSVSKWTRFISITGFIGLGLILIILLIAGSQVAGQLSSLSGLNGFDMAGAGVIIAIIVVAILIMVLWVYFLFKASNLLSNGLQSRDSAMIADGFRAMKIYFIISFVLSVLSLLSAVTTGF
jgi:nitric oxide reductase large subunit